jgi:hypothetical protein
MGSKLRACSVIAVTILTVHAPFSCHCRRTVTGMIATSLSCTVSSLSILEKGEQFLRVIGILALLCSHYQYGLK